MANIRIGKNRIFPGGKLKYGNLPQGYDGEIFHSKAELARFKQLKLLEAGGAIVNLRRQVEFELIPKLTIGGKVHRRIVYKADFTYTTREGQYVCEDVKGHSTPEYGIKKRLMKERLNIDIVEVAA